MESRVAVEATVSTASHTVQRLLVTSSMRVHTAQTETPPRDAAGAVSALWRREVSPRHSCTMRRAGPERAVAHTA